MPQVTRPQLVLLELAGASVCGGLYFKRDWSSWPVVGVAVAAVLVLLALVPSRGRWLYQTSIAAGGFLLRRRRSNGTDGLADLVGRYTVESVPGGTGHSAIGVVRSGTTWCLPLVMPLDGLLNDDPALSVGQLSELLRIEDIPLSSVRLLTLSAPPRVPPQSPQGPGVPLVPMVTRYLLLTLDSRRAAGAIASRGGTNEAVQQMLRRCAVHTEQALAVSRVGVRRLDAAGVQSLFTTWLGPASRGGHRARATIESWSDVTIAGAWSTVFAVSGEGPDFVARVDRLAAAAPTPLVATVLVLRPGDGGTTDASMLVRLSAPDTPSADAAASMVLLAQAYDLSVERLAGQQGEYLKITTPVGAGESV